jgi:integrase
MSLKSSSHESDQTVGAVSAVGNGKPVLVLDLRVNGASAISERDIPLPPYVSTVIDKHVADHGTTPDGYLFQGRKYKFVIRKTYQGHFDRSADTDVSKWLGHKNIEITYRIYGHLVHAAWERAREVLEEAFQSGKSGKKASG